MLIAVGIGGNWYWENSDISSKISSITANSKTLGEATFVDGTTEVTTSAESEYFSSARVDRQSARDESLEKLQESLEKLQKVVDSTEEDDQASKAAADKIASISSYIEIENKIETLVQAKGVSNCLAVINEDGTRVDVIVDSKELTDELALQIKEIATTQLKCGFENVTIIQSE
ncbi:MAG: SpoIIIAH-like family protein [Clostridiales bacterium]|nr:SpoIIIAH-like family protein [Clostridiales bacterium]